ncbi:importin-4 isoform X1 [Tachyglossus aculeatus]|nr:importin-4 isoform X1 [Tachyglossus aculeatus]
MVRHEGLEAWPGLLQLLHNATRSSHPAEKEMGLMLLSVVVASNPEPFRAHHQELLRLLHHTLSRGEAPGSLYYSLRTLTALVPRLAPDDAPLAKTLVPKILTALEELIRADEVKASEAAEVLDELLESELPAVGPHVGAVLTFCVEVAGNTALGDSLRGRLLCCVSFLVKVKSKAIVKQRLLSPLLHALFPIMSAEPPAGQLDPEDREEEEEEEEGELLPEGGMDSETPKHLAVQVVDMLALHLPPEKLFPKLMPLLDQSLRGQNPYQRKAGLMVLAVLAEGAGDHIRQRLLTPLLQVVCQSLGDPSQVVRNAALFAMGQFSENLQPHISGYCGEVMPLLLSYLRSVPPGHTRHLAKACYALENFVENLGAEVKPYLAELMERILQPLRGPAGPRVKELAVSLLGATASAAQGALLPYFPAIMEHLREYLVTGREDLRPLQIQSLETLGVLARVLEEAVRPLAEDCCRLGLQLCDQVDDPDLRRCTYSLLAALSGLMGPGLAPHLPQITTLMLLSLRSTEGIVPRYEGSSTFLLFEDESEEEEEEEPMGDDEEDEDDSDVSGYSVENAFFDEKEDACSALGEIALNASVAFLPYMDCAFEEVYKLLECPHLNVRKAAHETLGRFCRALQRAAGQCPSEQNSAALQAALGRAVPALVQAVQGERERLVVMSALEALGGLLKDCGAPALHAPGRLEELCAALRAVLHKRTACQDTDDEEEDEEEQAEYDAMLLEHAGEVIPALAAAAGGETFAPYFAGFLPLLLRKAKPSCSAAEKSFAVGTLAEAVQGLGPASAQFVSRLLPALLEAAREPDPEVRSNAVFGLGVLAEHGGPPARACFAKILGSLSSLLGHERHGRVLDNICGALARLLLAGLPGKPPHQVLPTLLRSLPLREDMEEWSPVSRCLCFLYQTRPQQVVETAPELLRVCSLVLGSGRLPKDSEAALRLLVTQLAQHHADNFQKALGSLPPDKARDLQAALGPA